MDLVMATSAKSTSPHRIKVKKEICSEPDNIKVSGATMARLLRVKTVHGVVFLLEFSFLRAHTLYQQHNL